MTCWPGCSTRSSTGTTGKYRAFVADNADPEEPRPTAPADLRASSAKTSCPAGRCPARRTAGQRTRGFFFIPRTRTPRLGRVRGRAARVPGLGRGPSGASRAAPRRCPSRRGRPVAARRARLIKTGKHTIELADEDGKEAIKITDDDEQEHGDHGQQRHPHRGRERQQGQARVGRGRRSRAPKIKIGGNATAREAGRRAPR